MTEIKVKLEDIVDIKTGLVLARKKAQEPTALTIDYKVITLRSTSVSRNINEKYFDDFISKEKISSDLLSSNGDIIIRISEPYTAVHITDKFSNKIIPSSFYIIKLKDAKILPEYLTWYLNSECAQKQFFTYNISSTVNIIKSSSLRQMKIQVPVLDKQKLIVNIQKLHLKELTLLDELNMEKQKIYKIAFKKFIDSNFQDCMRRT